MPALTASAGDPFDALGDANRRAVLVALRDGERSVQAIADELPISRPAVSRHLRLLKDAGLVTDRAAGTRRLYRLDERGADEIREFLSDLWGNALSRFRLLAENTFEPEPGP